MTNAETIVLYTVSTFAQTCAALAAFVGAVGLYKLQQLGAQRARTEHTVRGLLGGAVVSRGEVPNLPQDEIIRLARANSHEQTGISPSISARLREELVEWDREPLRRRRARTVLFIFEAWNLILIGVSLLGFNYVASLASCPATWWGVWLASAGTVLVTACAVFVWITE